MDNSKVIDADGHIIERSEELRRYLKPPFDNAAGHSPRLNRGTAIYNARCPPTRNSIPEGRALRTGCG
jgi:hypothetical protein